MKCSGLPDHSLSVAAILEVLFLRMTETAIFGISARLFAHQRKVGIRSNEFQLHDLLVDLLIHHQ
jgi:hypothetical protein